MASKQNGTNPDPAEDAETYGRHAARKPAPVAKPYRAPQHREGKPGGQSVEQIRDRKRNPWFGA